MLFLEAIGCQIKILGPGLGYLLSPQVIDQKWPKDTQAVQTISFASYFSTELGDEILLLKTPHTWVTEHGEIKLMLNKKLPP